MRPVNLKVPSPQTISSSVITDQTNSEPSVSSSLVTNRIQRRSSSTGLSSQATPQAARVRRIGLFRGRNPLRIFSIRGTGSPTRLRQSHVGGVWEFFNNGLFRFTPRGIGTVVRSDFFPVVGRYASNRRRISFRGQRLSQNSFGTGGGVFINGTFTRSRNGRVTARIVQSTFSSSAFVGIGGGISTGSQNTFNFAIRMRRRGRLLRPRRNRRR
ncbi:MAG: hypothetical protein AAFR31_20540 [Cyanobacteria bacterium J06627_8]